MKPASVKQELSRVQICTHFRERYTAYCPMLRRCVSEGGETTEEALENIKKAMKGYLLVFEEEMVPKKDAKIDRGVVT